MKLKKLICIVLALAILFSLAGCNRKWANFKKDEIESLSFELEYPNGVTKSDSDITDPKVISDTYQVLQKIKFNKKLPKIDNIWDNIEIVYEEPTIHHTLSIKLKDGGHKFLYIDSKTNYCYSPGEYRIYSDSGEQVLVVMVKYFQNKEESS